MSAPWSLSTTTGEPDVRVTLSAAPIRAIAPDGATAAMFKVGRFGTVHLVLLDLRSGSEHVVRLSPSAVGRPDDGSTTVAAPRGRRAPARQPTRNQK